LKYFEVADNLSKELMPIYVVFGQDEYLKQKTISYFKKFCIFEYEELNYSFYNEENFDPQTVINTCNGMPFGNLKKLIIVKDPPKLTKEIENYFISYAQNPNLTTCLVILSQEKFFLSLPNVTSIDCSTLDNTNLQKLIASQCKKQNKSILADAANLLILKCDGDALKITNEIVKLSFFVEDSLITKQHVEENVTNSFNLDIYKLSNALAERNASETLYILSNLLNEKTEPTIILSAISNSFRRMFLSQISTNQTCEEIAKLLNVKTYAVTKAKENAKKFTAKSLKKINELLTQTDYMIKSGQMSAINSIYYLVFNILII